MTQRHVVGVEGSGVLEASMEALRAAAQELLSEYWLGGQGSSGLAGYACTHTMQDMQ